ncbi:RNA polymerase sigma factor [Azohydromonas caseinilytica]|uniref:RNA polymerase sigma factor n=1 Tax=Azohydromonas caseinilytica TaxID=2728836 RepID=A0A848FFG9_9BURK|nr:RNA polymerase sigma factor [Azohydromonas caseinilytica]NML17585.1 RNA polymerase sigma factor [Azohydromonas caseinilytica]
MSPVISLPGPLPASPADDEPALVRRIVAGDVAAFELLMRRHNRRLYRLARATLRDAAEAEDALQEAYLAAYRHLGAFRWDCSLSTWLMRLLLNACHDRQRRQARRDNVVPMLNGLDGAEAQAVPSDRRDEPEDAAARGEMRALLERHLDALPEAFRTVFMLRCVEELSVEETAQCLDIPEATVRTRQFRARSLLREALAREIDLAERDLFGFAGARCDRIVAGVLARLETGAGRPD